MAEKNMIEYDGQEISTNVTRKYSDEQTQTPIVGSRLYVWRSTL